MSQPWPSLASITSPSSPSSLTSPNLTSTNDPHLDPRAGFVVFVVVSVVAALGMLQAFSFLAFTLFLRRRRFVRLSSPILSSVVVVGCVVGFAAAIAAAASAAAGMWPGWAPESLALRPLEQESSSARLAACRATPWLLSLSATVTFGALLLKSWRVSKIFDNPSVKRVVISDGHLLRRLAVLLALDLTLLGLWAGLDPLSLSPSSCSSPLFPLWSSLLLLLHSALLLATLIVAWSLRGAPQPFEDESKAALISVATSAIVTSTIISISGVLSPKWPWATDMCVAVGVIICSFVVQNSLFLPKIIRWFRDRDKRDQTGTLSARTGSMSGRTGPFAVRTASSRSASLADSDSGVSTEESLVEENARLKKAIKKTETRLKILEAKIEDLQSTPPSKSSSTVATKSDLHDHPEILRPSLLSFRPSQYSFPADHPSFQHSAALTAFPPPRPTSISPPSPARPANRKPIGSGRQPANRLSYASSSGAETISESSGDSRDESGVRGGGVGDLAIACRRGLRRCCWFSSARRKKPLRCDARTIVTVSAATAATVASRHDYAARYLGEGREVNGVAFPGTAEAAAAEAAAAQFRAKEEDGNSCDRPKTAFRVISRHNYRQLQEQTRSAKLKHRSTVFCSAADYEAFSGGGAGGVGDLGRRMSASVGAELHRKVGVDNVLGSASNLRLNDPGSGEVFVGPSRFSCLLDVNSISPRHSNPNSSSPRRRHAHNRNPPRNLQDPCRPQPSGSSRLPEFPVDKGGRINAKGAASFSSETMASPSPDALSKAKRRRSGAGVSSPEILVEASGLSKRRSCGAGIWTTTPSEIVVNVGAEFFHRRRKDERDQEIRFERESTTEESQISGESDRHHPSSPLRSQIDAGNKLSPISSSSPSSTSHAKTVTRNGTVLRTISERRTIVPATLQVESLTQMHVCDTYV